MPKAHISDFSEYSLFSIVSGAIYIGVPTLNFLMMLSYWFSITANPKSANLNRPSDFKMLAGLISLCIISKKFYLIGVTLIM